MSETERKILETAKKEFLERGFHGTSMRRIAALAGVTTGALYGYFDSKERIFDSLSMAISIQRRGFSIHS